MITNVFKQAYKVTIEDDRYINKFHHYNNFIMYVYQCITLYTLDLSNFNPSKKNLKFKEGAIEIIGLIHFEITD